MSTRAQLQAISELIDGLADEKTIEAISDLDNSLDRLAEQADNDNLQAVDEIIDGLTSKKTIEAIEELEVCLTHFNAAVAVSSAKVHALISLIDELAARLDNVEQRLDHLNAGEVD